MTRPPATPPTRPRKGQYAFWSYDQYPYFLGGEIHATRANPYANATRNDPPFLVQAGGYSGWFPARVILPPALGKATLELLRRLREERADFDKAVRQYWRFQLERDLAETSTTDILERIVDA